MFKNHLAEALGMWAGSPRRESRIEMGLYRSVQGLSTRKRVEEDLDSRDYSTLPKPIAASFHMSFASDLHGVTIPSKGFGSYTRGILSDGQSRIYGDTTAYTNVTYGHADAQRGLHFLAWCALQ